MVPEDPLLFIGIFTVTVVASNVLLAWRLAKLAKALQLSRGSVAEAVRQNREAQEQPKMEHAIIESAKGFTPEQLEQLTMLINQIVRKGPGRPKGAKDTKPRKPYAKSQPEAPPPQTTEAEDMLTWLERQQS